MIYPSPVSAPAREKRISWDSSLHPRTGTPRSGSLPRVRRSGTPHPRPLGTREAPFQVSAMPEYEIKSFEELRLADYEGSQVMASRGVAGRRATPAKGSPARSLFGGPFASPSTSRIGERHATPFPTFESHSHFTFGASNGEFGGQRSMQVPAPPSLNRSSTLFQGDPTSSSGSHAFPFAPFGFTFSPSTFGASNVLSGGQRTMQAPAPSTSGSSLNGSSSELFQSAPASMYDASASCFAFGPSNGEFGGQPPSIFRDLAFARFHDPPTFEPCAPTFTVGASNGPVEGQRAQQALSSFLGGIESPAPSHASLFEDSPALTPAIFDSPFAVRTIHAPVSRTRFRAPTQSPPRGANTPTFDSGGLGTFGSSGLDALASISRSAHASGSFGPDAKPRTPSNLLEPGGLLWRNAQARVPAAGLFAPVVNGELFPQPAPTASTTLSQQQPPTRLVLRSHDSSVRAPSASTPFPSQQKPPAARVELGSDDRSLLTDPVTSNPESPSSHSKTTQSNNSGRVVRKVAKARGLFVDASLEEVRHMVGFLTPDHIESAKNKAQLEGALRALRDGFFHCNVRHFKPEPNHSGRDPIRVSGKKSVLQHRLMWFLFHVEVDFSED